MVAHGLPMTDSSDDSADTVISVLDSRLLSQSLTHPDSLQNSENSNPDSDEMGNRQGAEKKKKKDEEPQEKKVEEKPKKKKGKKSKSKSKRSSQNMESDVGSIEGACASPGSSAGSERLRSKSKRPDVLADLGQHSPGSPLGSPESACGSQGGWSVDDESDVSTVGYSTPLLSTPQVQRYVMPKQPTLQQSSTERLEELGRSIERTIIDKLSDKPAGEGATAPAAAGGSAGGSAAAPERKERRNVRKKRALGQAVIDTDSFTLPLEDVRSGQTSSPSPTSKRLNVGTDKISLRASQESPVSPWLRDDDTPIDEEQMDEMFISCIDLSYNLADICSEKEFTEYGSLDSKKQARNPKDRSKDTSLSPRIARKPIVPMTPSLIPILPKIEPVDSRETPPKSDSSTSTLAEIGRDPVSDIVDLDAGDSATPPVLSGGETSNELKTNSKETAVTSQATKCEKSQQAKKKGKSKSKNKSKKRNSKSFDTNIEKEIHVERSDSKEGDSDVPKPCDTVCDTNSLVVTADTCDQVSDYDNAPATQPVELGSSVDPPSSELTNTVSGSTSVDPSGVTVEKTQNDTCCEQKTEQQTEKVNHKSMDTVNVDTTVEPETSKEAAIEDTNHLTLQTMVIENSTFKSNATEEKYHSSTAKENATEKADDLSTPQPNHTEQEEVKSTSEPTESEKATETSTENPNPDKADNAPTTNPNTTEMAEDSSAKADATKKDGDVTPTTLNVVDKKEESSSLSPKEPASPKHVPPPSPSAMDALAEIDEDDEEALEAMEDNSQMKEVQLFGETVFKRLSSLVESQSQDEDMEERFKDFHDAEDVGTDSPPVDLGSMALLSDSVEDGTGKVDEDNNAESKSAKEIMEELVIPATVVSVEKSVVSNIDNGDVLQLSNNDGVVESGPTDEKDDIDDGTLKRKKKKSSQKKNKKDRSKKGNVVKKPEIPAELKQDRAGESVPGERRESRTEDESEKENAPPKRESQQIAEVIDAYGIADTNVEKPTVDIAPVDDDRPRYESDGSDDDDSDSSFTTKSRSSEIPSSSSIELTSRGIPEIEETFSELLSVKHILEDLEDRTPTEEALPSFAGYDELRSPPEFVNGRRSRMSPAVTDRTESDLDISEQRDDISTDSMYADDEDDGVSEVLFSRSYSEPAGNEVVVSCTFYNTQHNNNNTNMDDSDDFWEDYSTADESFKQIEISADAASSTFQNARKQMHDIHQHLQDLRRQMEHLQEEVESATLTPEYSMDSEDKRPITE